MDAIEGVKVMFGAPAMEVTRNANFYDYFQVMDKPSGSPTMFVRGQSPARGRNIIIEAALSMNCTHIMFLDDDVIVNPDLFKKLFSHDKDIVSGLYLKRNYPHYPIIFDYVNGTGECVHCFPDDNTTGLIPIVAAGLGACLIKIEIFKALTKPWIRLGELVLDHWSDDIGFFRRVREAGFKSYCDLSAIVGHTASVNIWPQYVDGKWITTYDTNGTGNVSFPAVYPSKEEIEKALSGIDLVGQK